MPDPVTGILNTLGLAETVQSTLMLVKRRAARRSLIRQLNNLLYDFVREHDLPDKPGLVSNLRKKRVAQKLIEISDEAGYITLLKSFGVLNNASQTPQEAKLIADIKAQIIATLGSAGERQIVDDISKLESGLREGLKQDLQTILMELVQQLGNSNAETLAAYQETILAVQLERNQLSFSAPLFGEEPFSLKDIYQPPECSLFTVGEVGSGQPNYDPFASGTRMDLEELALKFLADAKYNEPLIIQGVAGAGKSTFTLKLCETLDELGLIPIRIRLRDVNFSGQNFYEALSAALEPEGFLEIPDIFERGTLFSQEIKFGERDMSPYVLVLDGWDELNLAGSSSFDDKIRAFMSQVRNLVQRGVRVIITGRPYQRLSETALVTDDTRLFTIKQFSPESLQSYLERLVELTSDISEDTDWQPISPQIVSELVGRYRNQFEAEGEDSDVAEILGLPLLSYLVLRLIAVDGLQVDELLKSPTELFRRLVEMTCEKAGKAPLEDYQPTGDQYRYRGEKLRRLLQDTATVMSATGEERIAERDLRDLLPYLGDHDLEAFANGEPAPLTKLLVSYFFKQSGQGRNLGAEFMHKSVREYLHAEGLVAYLKTLASKEASHKIRQELVNRLGCKPMSPAERMHTVNLLSWEIGRAGKDENALELGDWIRIRDLLTKVWGDYWVYDMNLISYEPYGDHTGAVLQLENTQASTPSVQRMIDANFGSGLFHLCAAVHSWILEAQGWNHDNRYERDYDPMGDTSSDPYQRRLGERTFFTPGGDAKDFKLLAARINAGGARATEFPAGTHMRGVNFRNNDLRGMDFSDSDLTGVDFTGCNVRGASFRKSTLRQITTVCDFSGADFTDANLSAKWNGITYDERVGAEGSTFEGTIFEKANLKGVVFGKHDNNEPGRAKGLTAQQLAKASELEGITIHKELEDELKQIVPREKFSGDYQAYT